MTLAPLAAPELSPLGGQPEDVFACAGEIVAESEEPDPAGDEHEDFVDDEPAKIPIDFPEKNDPFDDFEEDDFDDDFDDDFEEDWEDDLSEDDEFPDTFGGDAEEGDDDADSPFSDDPNFDDE